MTAPKHCLRHPDSGKTKFGGCSDCSREYHRAWARRKRADAQAPVSVPPKVPAPPTTPPAPEGERRCQQGHEFHPTPGAPLPYRCPCGAPAAPAFVLRDRGHLPAKVLGGRMGAAQIV
jgi:hypothetical protein